ncbi:MAG TPA: sigma 54-interacting transcriptional regulator [Vicinamibacterales bacterium]|nr:sigma 54-interacting transcriptional regulator [Vicinamibacterales bacterium]
MRAQGNGQIIGTSAAVVELVEEIDRVAKSDAKILVTGESGVGKELVAQDIHRRSPRAHRTMIAVNCAGLPETLLESELFGHVKGSFTGAYRDKPGKLEMADGGTMFLDEIGEMTLRMQGLLLRFMETGELQKVGADRVGARVNVRIIAATNRNLRDMIVLGTFREDLFYRLNVIHLTVPSLRERREDIPTLVGHFLTQFTKNNGYIVKGLAPETLRYLCEYSWPGNVRELENVIERLVVTSRTELVAPDDLPVEIRTHQGVGLRPKRERRRTVADELYKKLLDERESFWNTVYPLYMQREITRGNVRDLVRKGLEEARGNYKIVARLFNMEQREYKRFLNFLRKHDCQVPFKEYR